MSDALEAPAAAVQCGHVLALAAASAPPPVPALDWAEITLVLHATKLPTLVELIRGAGGDPGRSGSTGGVSWFVEPDLVWEPTALVLRPDATATSASIVAARLAIEALYTAAPPPPPVRSYRWLAELARATARAGLDGPEVWAEAALLGEPCEREVRVRAMHLITTGREPPLV